MPWFLIPFAVFFLCVMGQFWALRGVRRALVERHQQLWLEMSYKAWFIDNALARFALSSKHHDLNDPVLSGRVRATQLLFGVAILAWLALFVMMMTGLGLPSN